MSLKYFCHMVAGATVTNVLFALDGVSGNMISGIYSMRLRMYYVKYLQLATASREGGRPAPAIPL